MVSAPEPAPGQAARTPGQALYAQLQRRYLESAPVPPAAWLQGWDDLDPMDERFLEDAAQAAIAAYIKANGDPVDVRAVISEATGLPVVEVTRAAAQERPAPGQYRRAMHDIAKALLDTSRSYADRYDAALAVMEPLDLSALDGPAPAVERPAPASGDGMLEATWDAGAQAGREITRMAAANTIRGLREQARLAREDRDQLKARMLAVADELEDSAAVTAPSKKSAIENATAGKVRKALDVQ